MAAVAGLSLQELVASTGRSPVVLEWVLRDEVARGRVVAQDGTFALRPGCLSPEVAEALRGLTPPDTAVPGERPRPTPTERRTGQPERAGEPDPLLSPGGGTGNDPARFPYSTGTARGVVSGATGASGSA
jgi:hypothetical protein